MKKILIIILTLIGFIPILKCEELNGKEMEYKWYILKEKDIHYEKDVENVCEYFDKNDFTYTDYKYSLNEPEEIEGRIIERSNEELNIHRYIFNEFDINGFFIHYTLSIDVSEIRFYTNDGELIPYTLENTDCKELYDGIDDTSCLFRNLSKLIFKFDEAQDLRNFNIVLKYFDDDLNFKGINFSVKLTEDISLNTFYSYNHITSHECTDDAICTYKIKMDFDNMFNDDITFNSLVYKYKDRMYKCYTYEKIYAPGYYKELDGYIKDENDYRIVEDKPKENNEIIKEIIINEPIYKDIPNKTEEKSTIIDKPTSTVAMVDNNKEKNNIKENEYYILYSLILIILLLGTYLFIKKLKKSRTK